MIDWMISGLSIYGSILNVRQNKYGFLVWIMTNIYWIYYNFQTKTYAQIPVWIIFTIISIYGLVTWKK